MSAPVGLVAAAAVAVGWLARRVDDAGTDGLTGLAKRRRFDRRDRVSVGSPTPEVDPAAVDLARGLEAGELFVVHQPLVDLRSGNTVGVEALVRWRHPTRGVVGPDEFVPVAEAGDLIHPLGRIVLEQAVAQGVRWRHRGLVVDIGVNVAGGELARPDYAAHVQRVLGDAGLPARNLTVEVTERTLDADSPQVLETLHQLRATGVRVALDDFGTGYSNLSRLDRLPVDVLKIDQSFIRPLDATSDTAVIAAVVALGTALRLEVVGEGVETAEQASILHRLGCGQAQGYHFGRPGEVVDDAPPRRDDRSTADTHRSTTDRRRNRAAGEPRRADPVVDAGNAATVEARLADLECRRYSGSAGIAEEAQEIVDSPAGAVTTAQRARAELIVTDQASRTGEVPDAIATAQSILLRARARGEPTVAASSEAVIAWCLDRMGARGDALTHAVEAVRLLPSDAPRHMVVNHRMILALFTALQTPDDSYRPVFDDVLADAEALGNPHLLLSVLNNYAWISWNHGDAAAALPLVGRLRTVAAAAGITMSSTVLDTIASVLLDTGDLEQAEAVGRSMIVAGIPEAEVRAAPEALLTLARIRHRRGDPADALTLVLRAEQLAADRGLPEITAMATMDESKLRAEAGDTAGAYAALSVSYAAWVRVRDRDADARAASLQAIFETEQARQRSAIFEDLADHDALTGLWNRRHLDRVLPDLLTDHQVTGIPLSVAILDLDHFKQLNDHRSHAVGDAVLTRVGELLTDLIPEPGFTARLGGEEFLLALPGADPAAAHAFCDRVRRLIGHQPWDAVTTGIPVTASIGHATSAATATVASLLSSADSALYDAKRDGRNRVRPVPPPTGPAQTACRPDLADGGRAGDTPGASRGRRSP